MVNPLILKRLFISLIITTVTTITSDAQLGKLIKEKVSNEISQAKNTAKLGTYTTFSEFGSYYLSVPNFVKVKTRGGMEIEGLGLVYHNASELFYHISPFDGSPVQWYKQADIDNISFENRVFIPSTLLDKNIKADKGGYSEIITAGNSKLILIYTFQKNIMLLNKSLLQSKDGEYTTINTKFISTSEIKEWLSKEFSDFPELVNFLKTTKDSYEIVDIFKSYNLKTLPEPLIRSSEEKTSASPSKDEEDDTKVKIKKGEVSINEKPFVKITSKGNPYFSLKNSGTISSLSGTELITFQAEGVKDLNEAIYTFINFDFPTEKKNVKYCMGNQISTEKKISELIHDLNLVNGNSINAEALEVFSSRNIIDTLGLFKAQLEKDRAFAGNIIKRKPGGKIEIKEYLAEEIYVAQENRLIGYLTKVPSDLPTPQFAIYAINPEAKKGVLVAKNTHMKLLTVKDKKAHDLPSNVTPLSLATFLIKNGYL